MNHYGTDIHGHDYEIEVTRGLRFSSYETPGFERLEVGVEEGVITMSQFIPDEMTQWQARALAAMLMEAADALEESDAQVVRDTCATLGEDAE